MEGTRRKRGRKRRKRGRKRRRRRRRKEGGGGGETKAVPFGSVSALVVIKSLSFFQKPVIQEGTLMRFSCSSRAAHKPLEHD